MTQKSNISPSCVRKCEEFQAENPHHGKRYELGQKRCQFCNQWMRYEGIWCPCCNNQLRTRPRCKKYEAEVPRI